MKVTLEIELDDYEQVRMLTNFIHVRFADKVKVITERVYKDE